MTAIKYSCYKNRLCRRKFRFRVEKDRIKQVEWGHGNDGGEDLEKKEQDEEI